MSGTRKKFLSRVEYYERTKNISHFYHFDNWEQKKFFYARINRSGRVVAPLDRVTLKQIPGSNLIALDFVVDAFADLNYQYTQQVSRGTLTPILNSRTLTAKKAYINPVSLYQDHLKYLQNAFFENYLNPYKDKITFFKDIVFYFMKFAKDISREEPLLFSYFVKSTRCPIHSTGLVLETADTSHDTDEAKYQILHSKDFNFYTKLAARYGFVIPRHAPWTFVANLDSTIMFDYVRQYDVTSKDTIMREYFYECQGFDVDMVRKFLYDVYVEFARLNAVRRTVNVCPEDGKIKTKARNVLRPPLTDVMAQYDSQYWFNVYLQLLVIENKIKISKKRFELLSHDCYAILINDGFERAIDFAEMKILNKRKDVFL